MIKAVFFIFIFLPILKSKHFRSLSMNGYFNHIKNLCEMIQMEAAGGNLPQCHFAYDKYHML
jgi:hypothetical protein